MLSNNATHVLRGYKKAYCSYNGIVGGQKGMFLSRFKNGMRKQGKETGLGFFMVGGESFFMHGTEVV